MAALLILAGLVHAPDIDAPLLEGAAGKQTHTAMVARNFYRETASLAFPRVDDVGKPGYFIKEFPIFPALAAGLYRLHGAVDERILRLLSLICWLVATPVLAGLLRPTLGNNATLIAAFWFLFAPMSLAYAAAATSDTASVALSLAGLAAVLAWRARPGVGPALLSGLLVALAFLLKPHTALWLGPAAGVAVLAADGGRRAEPRQVATIVGIAGLALLLSATWYLHAARIHQIYPVAGTTVAQGWVNLSLLMRADLYTEIGRQTLNMVFSPPGAALALLGLLTGARLGLAERALLAWGAGVLLQCLIFAPRMFDAVSRGTEYYQLALVPCASFLVARGFCPSMKRLRGLAPRAAPLGAALLTLILGATTWIEASRAKAPPARYASLLADCEQIRAQTHPDDRFLVLADRTGTILYYCDRKGLTLSLGKANRPAARSSSERARPEQLAKAMTESNYLFLPFPDLLDRPDQFFNRLGRDWVEVPFPDSAARLFANPLNPPRGWKP